MSIIIIMPASVIIAFITWELLAKKSTGNKEDVVVEAEVKVDTLHISSIHVFEDATVEEETLKLK